MLLESAGMDIKIVTPREAGIKEIHIEETAETLAENAELKAGVVCKNGHFRFSKVCTCF